MESSADLARELREKRRQLAALVVHDLRSPLAGILGCLQLVREDLETRDGLPRAIGLGNQRVREAELGRLAQPLLAALHRPHLPRQADFAKNDELGRQGHVLERGHDREQYR